ncbi:MAG: sterol desaturase family protein [Gemmatimonadetes bacterium]|nr:sterol desaturase family protein [Gemmatimonadota bacterium]
MGPLMMLTGAIVLSATTLAVAFSPGTGGRFQALLTAIHGHVVATVPGPIMPIAARGAEVFLSPWLYLVMLICFLAERYFPARAEQRFFSVGFVQDLVGWFLVNSLLRVALIGAFAATLDTLFQTRLSFLRIIPTDVWPPAVGLVGGLLVADFLKWLHHWIRHKVPLFWVFHAVHHSQREMNMFTDLRVHVVEYLIALPVVAVPLFMLGLTDITVIWILILMESYSRVYHANIRSDFGVLRYVFVTPQSHRIHHSSDLRHHDHNFAVVFSFWDRLMGTQWDDHTEYPDTGIRDPAFPHETSASPAGALGDYARQTIYPFKMVWNAAMGRGWTIGGADDRN